MKHRTKTLRAPAKINWVLDLLGIRNDGYTEVATILQTVSLHDEVAVSIEEGSEGRIALEIDGPKPCPDEDNLVVRAARSYFALTGGRMNLRIRLKKNIPTGAGLGGGSSDAAAVLRALAEFFPESLKDSDLVNLAANLGADVPFFLTGGLALGTGRGDRIESLPETAPKFIVLVMPKAHLSTKEVFAIARKRLTPRGGSPNIHRFLGYLRSGEGGSPPSWNALQDAALSLCPEIATWILRLEKAGGRASMTGSGAAVFGVFEDEENATKAYDGLFDGLEAEGARAWRVVTTTRREYESSA